MDQAQPTPETRHRCGTCPTDLDLALLLGERRRHSEGLGTREGIRLRKQRGLGEREGGETRQSDIRDELSVRGKVAGHGP